MSKKERKVVIIVGIIGIFFILAGALYNPILNLFKKETETISNTFEVTYQPSKTIKLNTKNKVVTDKATNHYNTTITINNITQNEATYRLRIGEKTSDSIINRSDIKVAYKINDQPINVKYLSSLSNDLTLINSIKLTKGETVKIYFYIWLDDAASDSALNQDYNIELISEKLILTNSEAEDKQAPQIVLNGDNVITISKGEAFTDPGINSVTDNVDGNISLSNVSIRYEYMSDDTQKSVKEIDTNKEGIYYIYYTVADYANNMAEVTRMVIVKGDNSNSQDNPDNQGNSNSDSQNSNSNNNNQGTNNNSGNNSSGGQTQPESQKEKLKLNVSYEPTSITRGTVTVTITSNKELYSLSGFTLSNDKKTLTKIYSENIKSNIIVLAKDNDYETVNIEITNIDNSVIIDPEPQYTIPTLNLRIVDIKSNSITFKAIPSDENKVSKYYFTCDGTNYNLSASNTYTCENLKHNSSYNVNAKIIDIKNNDVYATSAPTKTLKIESPKFTSSSDSNSWKTSNSLTINYGSKQDNYIFQYKTSSSGWINVPNTSTTISLNNNDTITARIIDSTTNNYNEVLSSYIESKIDNTAPSCLVSIPYSGSNLSTQAPVLNKDNEAYYKVTCTDTISGLNSDLTNDKIISTNQNIISSLEIIKTKNITSGKEYTVKVKIGAGAGNATIKVVEGALKDNAGNRNAEASGQNLVVDNQPPVVSNSAISANNITKNSFSISWNNASDNTTVAANLKYYVCMSSSNNISIDNCKGTYQKYTGNNLNSYNFTNLQPSTAYYVNVVVEDSFGHSTIYTTSKVTTSSEMVVQGSLDIGSKSNLVGILYSTWFNYMHGKTPTIYDNTNGPKNYGSTDFVYWGKPAKGYYNSTDKDVIKKQLTELNDAGIDFIILDITNVTPDWIGSTVTTSGIYYQYVTAPIKALMQVMTEMRNQGLKTPYVVPWIKNTNDDIVSIKVFMNLFMNNYDEAGLKADGFDKAAWANNWVYWNNNIFMLTTEPISSGAISSISSATGGKTVTNRAMYSDRVANFTNSNTWAFLQYTNTRVAGSNEQISVAPAVQQSYMSTTTTAKGRNNGKTFYDQWQNAFNSHPKVVVISSYNEWGSEAISASGKYNFTDNYNEEYSRDIEPENGGLSNTYLNWMKQYISAYKNNSTIPKLYN